MLPESARLRDALEAWEHTGELLTLLQDSTEALGFEYFSYGHRPALPAAAPRIAITTNYPPAWQARYVEAQYIKRDPSILESSKSIRPLVWSDSLFEPVPSLWAEAQEHGLRIGCAQFLYDGQGNRGMLSLARGQGAITNAELAEKDEHIHWLAVLVHEHHSRQQPPSCISKIVLTEREKDILRWAADGKTAIEIAEILPISVNTVKFHFKNIIQKLSAPNKTAAVLRAAMYGLLD